MLVAAVGVVISVVSHSKFVPEIFVGVSLCVYVVAVDVGGVV